MINQISNKTTLTDLTNPSITKKTTTITPFEKVLSKVENTSLNKYNNSTSEVSSDTETENTSASSASSSGTSTAKLADIFQRASEKYDVPYNLLVAVAKAESNFHATSVSSCGAQGIMQLMPATAKSLGVENSFDAEQNIMGGAKYLAKKLNDYDGDVELALAAYNAGSAAVKKYGGIPPFTETQNYVKKVTNYMNTAIEVPNQTVTTSSTSETASSAASDDESLQKSTVVVGPQNGGVKMTYEAYLRYVELGTHGVG